MTNSLIERRARGKVRQTVQTILVTAFAAASAATQAQQPQVSDEGSNGAAPLEVVVTGSRIAQPQLASTTPVEVVNSASLENIGTINVASALKDLPAVGTPTLSLTNSNFLTSDSGVSSLNLRNLGESRTLVLVNGRRMTPGVSGTTWTDINTIPTEFIDRIEIITGGASAIYGSDAVGGVVNFITKKNFEGVQFTGQGGRSFYNDDGTYTMGVLLGSAFADNRGHFMLNVSHDSDGGLASKNRRLSAVDMFASSSGLINPQFSSYTPQGNFLVSSAQGGFSDLFSFGADGSLIDGSFGPGFNRSADRLISVPVERTLIASTASYDLSAHHQLYAEFTYANSTTRSNIEALPLDSNGANSVYNSAGDVNGDLIAVPITNAYLQTLPILAPVLSQINAWNSTGNHCVGTLDQNSPNYNPDYDCVSYFGFRRRLSDIADRSNSSTRQLHRIVLGAKGDLPFGDWTYDASYVYGETTDAQITTGAVNLLNFQQALNSVVDASGNIVCADPVAVAQGCVPVNIFGVNSITPDAAKYLNATITRNATISQQVVSGSVTGTVASLPGGRLALAAGVEFRKDKSSEIWDPLTNAGLNGSNVLPNVLGSIDVKEAFVEVEAPLLKDLPGIDSLSVSAAFRQADYSTSGNVNSWKVGLNWSPLPDLRVRAVLSRAVRAANIGELYGGQSQTFVSIQDPCAGVSATSNGSTNNPQVAAACRSIPGVAAAIANGGTFAYSALDTQREFGLVGSNPNLGPEKSKTITAGLVLTPRALRGFNMTVDYFDIKINDGISSTDPDFSAFDCIATGNQASCNNITRDPTTGKITQWAAFNQNVGYIRSSGIDTSIGYRVDLPVGNLSVSLAETHQLKLEQQIPGSPVENDIGSLSGSLGAGFKDRATADFTYVVGGFQVNWRVNYLGSIKDATDPALIVYEPYNNVPAFWYNNVQFRYTWDLGDRTSVSAYLGSNNVFNKQPPFLPSGMNSNVTGTSTDASIYDVIGATWYAGFKAKF